MSWVFCLHVLQQLLQVEEMIILDVVEILPHCIAEVVNVFSVAAWWADGLVDLTSDVLQLVIFIPRRVLLVGKVNKCRLSHRSIRGVEFSLVTIVTVFLAKVEVIQNLVSFVSSNFVSNSVDDWVNVICLHKCHNTARLLRNTSVIDWVLIKPSNETFEQTSFLQLVLKIVIFPNL